jgi:hypothetical protein
MDDLASVLLSHLRAAVAVGMPVALSIPLALFGGDFSADATFDGVIIPSGGRLGWHYGTDRWSEGEFFRYSITGLELAART